ncbi:adenine phosphoribosyltransferase [Pseudopedobacter saltans DSM 12145]|uniref:Adenine phosphoribosyltransferase n=1 Tax=Pseudopedobacter saltans (strain ATCC 51119 / DSM 12145 / JCM 21818 / CCUG 39354 / LMG 10337 / NBRC 100064 / NCIMB 13643) TaxID=762903 RepID=F0SCJ0_PSESL|nr:adenine phosphoribosyltransferase [Pseudopedobacter saltans]ADY52824.1 adenine phosphoribosyltransferase [Pseudopedobacter saltans DSM 12145]
MIEQKIRSEVRDIIDFPKDGIVFKDITPILKNPALCTEIVEEFVTRVAHLKIDAIVGIESRGFLFGMLLANRLQKPFIPVRKEGKLPYKSIKTVCDLEYGTAVLEIHQDAFPAGSKVLLHDDLLATGGTISAAVDLIQQLGGNVVACSFLISLNFLDGKKLIEEDLQKECIVLLEYQ